MEELKINNLTFELIFFLFIVSKNQKDLSYFIQKIFKSN